MNSTDLMTTFFGPLSKKFCLYFYWLSIIFFVLLIFSIISTVIFAIMNPKRITMPMILNTILVWFNIALLYLVNRLLNTMCLNSTSHY